MLMARELALFTLAEADTFRKGIGKKDPALVESLKQKFVDGCKRNGLDETTAKKVFELCESFAGYGFNKCLTGDTTIRNKVDNKLYSLGELSEMFAKRKNIDIVIDSYDHGIIIEDKVVDVFATGNQEVYEVELSNGALFTCTMEHKFVCTDGHKRTLREAVCGDFEIVCDAQGN